MGVQGSSCWYEPFRRAGAPQLDAPCCKTHADGRRLPLLSHKPHAHIVPLAWPLSPCPSASVVPVAAVTQAQTAAACPTSHSTGGWWLAAWLDAGAVAAGAPRTRSATGASAAGSAGGLACSGAGAARTGSGYRASTVRRLASSLDARSGSMARGAGVSCARSVGDVASCLGSTGSEAPALLSSSAACGGGCVG